MNLLQGLQAATEKKGFALGRGDIKNDTIDFRFRDEVFTFPARDVADIVRCNGSFYEAKIDDLRKLKKASSG